MSAALEYGPIPDRRRHGRIDVEQFDFWYGRNQALFDINLQIVPRAVTALIGPSGCGKSTFLRSINRLNELIPGAKRSGVIRLDGDDIYQKGMDVVTLRQRVGMVFQRWNPFPKSIYDNVAYGPRINASPRRQELDVIVESALRRAALWDEVKDRLRDSALALSGGQQQRLCIARALAIEPDVVLMDEPASALDPISTQSIEDLVEQLKSEYSIIIVTHNMQQAARVADVTAFFSVDVGEDGSRSGVLVEQGPTSKLFIRPADPRTEAYVTGRFG